MNRPSWPGTDAASTPGRRPLSPPAGHRLDEQAQHFSHGPLTRDCITQRQMPLNFVPVPPTVLLFQHITRFVQVGYDAVRLAFGDRDFGRDVTQPSLRVERDAKQDLPMIREKTPYARHHSSRTFMEINC